MHARQLFLKDAQKRGNLTGKASNLLSAFPLLLLAFHARSEGRDLVAKHVPLLLHFAALTFPVKIIELFGPLLDLLIGLVDIGLSVSRRAAQFFLRRGQWEYICCQCFPLKRWSSPWPFAKKHFGRLGRLTIWASFLRCTSWFLRLRNLRARSFHYGLDRLLGFFSLGLYFYHFDCRPVFVILNFLFALFLYNGGFCCALIDILIDQHILNSWLRVGKNLSVRKSCFQGAHLDFAWCCCTHVANGGQLRLELI